jgi:hypothetical protein
VGDGGAYNGLFVPDHVAEALREALAVTGGAAHSLTAFAVVVQVLAEDEA